MVPAHPQLMNPFSRAPAKREPPPTAAQLHQLYLDEVFRYVSRRLPRREDAEDVTAETFAAAFMALPKFRGEVEARLWLLGIARRKIAHFAPPKTRHRFRCGRRERIERAQLHRPKQIELP